jgi:hypothetical protein
MDNRDPRFYGAGAWDTFFPSDFLWIANKPKDFAPRCASHGPRHPSTPTTRAAYGATAKRARRDTRHTHAQLEGQFRSSIVQCSWVECHNFYSKRQPYLIYATAIFNFITARTIQLTDELRTRCSGEEAVPSGRVLGVGPVPPCSSDHAKSERTRSALALAAVGALQFRRSRYDGSTSRWCARAVCKRT